MKPYAVLNTQNKCPHGYMESQNNGLIHKCICQKMVTTLFIQTGDTEATLKSYYIGMYF